MRGMIRSHLAPAAVLLALVGILSFGPVSQAAGEDKAKLDRINATPTDDAGIYHVMPVYKKLVEVKVFRRGGPYGKEHTRVLKPGTEWSFDEATGRLTIKVPVDDKKMMVSVAGERVLPWAWKAPESLKPGSVKVLLADGPGVRGRDFDVDEKTGSIRFLKMELCDRKKDYYISYGYPDDPKKPNTSRSGAIGNHRNRAAVRRFLGLPEAGLPTKDTVGTNASATEDPRTYTLVQPMRSNAMKVAIAKKGKPGDLNWLKRGKDYSYDELVGTIVLSKDVRIDGKKEHLFVRGTPRARNVFLFHRTLEKGTVRVILGKRRLTEGTGFTVDYAQGIITVLDKGILETGARFYVTAGSFSFGNHDDRALIRKLLQED